MNTASLARSAYGGARSAVRTPRQDEYAAFVHVTRRLVEASSGAARDFPALAAALHDNRRLWTALASDVATPGNALPQKLRAGIFHLAEFTRAHTRKVLAGDADAAALIDVNMAMMRGLRNAQEPDPCPA
jgi:flagellar biosynthesis activator protein FlaF